MILDWMFLTLLQRFSHRNQRVLAKHFPVIFAIIGTGCIASLSQSVEYPEPVPGVLAGFLWGMGAYLGSKSRKKIRQLLRTDTISTNAPSWNLAMIYGFIGFSGALIFTGSVSNIDAWLAFGLAVNIAYIGAKVRCQINRCCESNVKKFDRYYFDFSRITLQEYEALASVLVTLFSI
ncbi:MAG: hypothetical protein AB2805_14300 [Candidatus Thiodiazotropha sp.]